MLKKYLAVFIVAALFTTVTGILVPPPQPAEAAPRTITHTTVHWRTIGPDLK